MSRAWCVAVSFSGGLLKRPCPVQARQERAAPEWERRRPVCRRCKVSFSDERWAEKERGWNDDGLCAGCRQADADQKALEAAERERAAAEAKRRDSWWRTCGQAPSRRSAERFVDSMTIACGPIRDALEITDGAAR
ncbi:hypothetical protein ACH4E7_32210 [Kitasatospora sp. NPDC018058]|uniref:hypothetical protein n=1 Tax=Kitasatospora sp. NPDC018058 TaxID=3364025 RepID=UPI0037C0CE45